MKSKLQETLEKKSKVITAELMPPRGGSPVRSLKIAQLLKDKVHAVNITDGSRAVMRMCSLAMSKLLLENGIEPVMQISCRDRNKIALQSDILGANALGIKNILCITGDSVKAGDQQNAKAVHEFESVKLLQQIQAFNKGIDPTLGELSDKKTHQYLLHQLESLLLIRLILRKKLIYHFYLPKSFLVSIDFYLINGI